MIQSLRSWLVGLCAFAAVAGGCSSTIPKSALALSPQSLERRQLQTRTFDTTNEGQILQASAGLLQDLGFTLDSTQSTLGLLSASKEREAREGGQIVGAVLVSALLGVRTDYDRNQRIRASVVTHPSGGKIAVRVTFQRVVWNTANQITRLEFVDDVEIYQEFFSKLSKSVFLEAHEI